MLVVSASPPDNALAHPHTGLGTLLAGLRLAQGSLARTVRAIDAIVGHRVTSWQARPLILVVCRVSVSVECAARGLGATSADSKVSPLALFSAHQVAFSLWFMATWNRFAHDHDDVTGLQLTDRGIVEVAQHVVSNDG